jgi:hypothetical protein
MNPIYDTNGRLVAFEVVVRHTDGVLSLVNATNVSYVAPYRIPLEGGEIDADELYDPESGAPFRVGAAIHFILSNKVLWTESSYDAIRTMFAGPEAYERYRRESR